MTDRQSTGKRGDRAPSWARYAYLLGDPRNGDVVWTTLPFTPADARQVRARRLPLVRDAPTPARNGDPRGDPADPTPTGIPAPRRQTRAESAATWGRAQREAAANARSLTVAGVRHSVTIPSEWNARTERDARIAILRKYHPKVYARWSEQGARAAAARKERDRWAVGAGEFDRATEVLRHAQIAQAGFLQRGDANTDDETGTDALGSLPYADRAIPALKEFANRMVNSDFTGLNGVDVDDYPKAVERIRKVARKAAPALNDFDTWLGAHHPSGKAVGEGLAAQVAEPRRFGNAQVNSMGSVLDPNATFGERAGGVLDFTSYVLPIAMKGGARFAPVIESSRAAQEGGRAFQAARSRVPTAAELFSKESAARAQARLREKVYLGIDPSAFGDLVVLAGHYIGRFKKPTPNWERDAFPIWARDMVKQYGDRIASHLQSAWQEGQRHLAGESSILLRGAGADVPKDAPYRNVKKGPTRQLAGTPDLMQFDTGSGLIPAHISMGDRGLAGIYRHPESGATFEMQGGPMGALDDPTYGRGSWPVQGDTPAARIHEGAKRSQGLVLIVNGAPETVRSSIHGAR